jgi:hypothetical protein
VGTRDAVAARDREAGRMKDGPAKSIDLTTLALPADAVPPVRVRVDSPARRRRRQHFVQVPWTWLERLMTARHVATPLVAMVILYQHWKHRGGAFALSNSGPMADISRWGKHRALAELEVLGLIAVERRPNKAPLVRVL